MSGISRTIVELHMAVVIFEGANSHMVQNEGSCQSLLALMVLSVLPSVKIIWFNDALVNFAVLHYTLV